MNPIVAYNAAIQTGQIPACKKLKKVYSHLVDNMKKRAPYHYDEAKARRAVGFIETFCTIPKLAGSPPLTLELWEKAFISAVFGFVDDAGARQYREVFLFVGRKNRKTCLAAAIALYLLVADGEEGPELYSAATDRQQAKIVWEYAKIMIARSASLKKRIRSKAHSIESPSNFGKFVPLSKNSGSLDGLNASGIFIDELHAIKDRNIYDVLKGGTYARTQPLTVIMSTGGYSEKDSIFDTKYEEYAAIIKGYSDHSYTDETTLPLIYEMDSKEEIADERTWIKANPNLRVSKKISTLRTEYNRATLCERSMRDLLVKQFNFKEYARAAFFELADVTNKTEFSLDTLAGAYCIGGVDLSETTDLTAATALIPYDGALYIEQMYWIPEQTLQTHIEKDKVPYDIWIKNGWLRTCPGNVIDQRVIVSWFQELQAAGIYIYKIGYDAYNAQYLTKDLETEFGAAACVKVSQSFKGLSSQMFLSKAYFKEKKIIYNDNPVFLWCVLNTEAVTDTQGNIKPYKNRNLRKRIDGYSSFLDAFCVYLDEKDNL